MPDWLKLAPEQIVSSARTYLDSPYHHDGRSREGGVDCAGLVVCAMQDLGLEVPDFIGTPQGDVYAEMCGRFGEFCFDLSVPHAAKLVYSPSLSVWALAGTMDGNSFERVLWPGDALVFRSRAIPNHVGVMDTAGGMIHAFAGTGSVVRTPLDPQWVSRLVRIFRYRGAEWPQ
jgi:cell wall-associated NlpC family hydrolase